MTTTITQVDQTLRIPGETRNGVLEAKQMPSKRKGPIGAGVATDWTITLFGPNPTSSLRALRMRNCSFCLIVVAVIYFVLFFQSPNSNSTSGSFYLFCLLCRLWRGRSEGCWAGVSTTREREWCLSVFRLVSSVHWFLLALFCFLCLLLHSPRLPPLFPYFHPAPAPTVLSGKDGCTARGLSASLPGTVLVLVVQTASCARTLGSPVACCPLSVRSFPAVSPHAPLYPSFSLHKSSLCSSQIANILLAFLHH